MAFWYPIFTGFWLFFIFHWTVRIFWLWPGKQKKMESIVTKFLTPSDGESGLFDNLIDQDIEAVIDSKLDDLIIVFKKKIPMGASFLSGKLADSLKEQAKEELMKATPKIKQRIQGRFQKEKIASLIARAFLKHVDQKFFYWLWIFSLYAFSLGVLIGVLAIGMYRLSVGG